MSSEWRVGVQYTIVILDVVSIVSDVSLVVHEDELAVTDYIADKSISFEPPTMSEDWDEVVPKESLGVCEVSSAWNAVKDAVMGETQVAFLVYESVAVLSSERTMRGDSGM